MKEFFSMITAPGAASTILFISLTALFGMLLGKVPFFRIKFGVAGVLFVGLLLGHLGASSDASVIQFARDFGLILFVYSIGIDIGPRFFRSFRNEGLRLNLLAALLVFLGFSTAYIIQLITHISPAAIAGIMCGSVTNTPGLGAAQQILAEQGAEAAGSPVMAGMGYAVTYPLGIIGVIVAMILIRKLFRIDTGKEVTNYRKQFSKSSQKLETVRISVTKPSLIGVTIGYIKKEIDNELVISRIERDSAFLVAQREYAFNGRRYYLRSIVSQTY